MADRYWVGGSGTWNTTSTTNWAASSGGAAGASAPTSSDNVFFDANSNVGTGSFTVTVSAAVCNDFTVGSPTALDGAMTLAMGTSTLTVSGSWTNPATNFSITGTTGTITFNATTTGKTITTNGVTFNANVTLNGVGGVWTLGSALNIGSFTLTLTNGTFDTSTSNYAVTAGSFSSSNANTRTINLNGSTITLSVNWTLTTSTNATLNAGTSTINLSASGLTFNGGGLTYYNLSFTSTSASSLTRSIAGANTFNNLTFSTIASAGLNNISVANDQTINGTLTVNGANGNRRQFVRSDATGTSRTLTCAAIAAMTDVDFRDITIAGAAGTLSGTRLGDCGGNSNITFGAGTNKYWSLVAGGDWNATAWATSSGGTPADTNYPLPQDTVIIENTGLNTSATITINGSWNIGTLDASTRTNAMTLASGIFSPTFYGNFTYGSGVTPTGSGTYLFLNRSTKTLDSGGKTFTQSVLFNSPNGGTQIVNNNLTLSLARTVTLSQGTLDLNDFTLTAGIFSSSNTNARSIAFGTTGSIVLNHTTGGTTVLDMQNATNFTFTGTSNVSSEMSTARTFNFGGNSGATTANRLNINLTSGTSLATLLGSFRQIDFTGSTFNPSTQTITCHGFTLASGGTYSVTNFIIVGTGTLTYTGKSISTLNINGTGITTTLADAGTNGTLTLTNGTLDLAGFTLTNTTRAQTAAGTKNLTFNGGTLVISSSSATAWNNAAPTGFTTTAGTGVGTISMTSSSAKTFVGGSRTYNCTLNQGGAGTLTITGANTFIDITNTNTTSSQITFPASTTTTVNNFTLSGSSGNLVSIRSSSSGTRFTLSKSSGDVSVSYLDIQDSNATGGAAWRALTSNGNVNSGNNFGWAFIAGIFVDASAAVSGSAVVSGIASAIMSLQGSVNANATVTAIPTRLLMGQGSINCDATVTATGIRIQTASGSVTASATVTAAPNFTASGNAAIAANAAVSAYGNATFDNAPIITGNAIISANGQIIGEEWSDSAVTSSAWGVVPSASNTWTANTQTNSEWLKQ